LVGESPILTIEINRQLRGLVAALFMPVFFGLAGLTADLSVLNDPDLALLTLGLVAIASIGKAAGAFAGGWFGGLTAKESTALAMGMNARGSTEIMVASIGLSMGVLSHNLFTMIVAMAVITTMAMPPTLRWALQRLPVRREEKKRLAREQYESRAFVPSVERILLGIDGPNNGRFSSQIVGLLAGSRNTPVTVLNLDGSKGEAGLIASAKSETDPAVEAVQGVVAAAGAAKPRDSIAPKIDVIKREHDAPAAEAIIAEAQRGYDLLVLGVEQITSSDGEFHSRISALTAAFEGSIAIVAARGQHERDPTRPPKKILVPITGNENSLRGAEIAMAVAKSAGAEVVALSVISPEAKNKRRGRRETEAVAKEIKKVAGHYEARVTTAVRFDVSAVDAILQMIERGKHDLVAIGVSRRPGDVLSFGEVAHSLLRSAKCSLIFIAPQVRTGRAP
jgi:nucleotide-binding universal stress UspA family protein